jgi:hypothetical protein
MGLFQQGAGNGACGFALKIFCTIRVKISLEDKSAQGFFIPAKNEVGDIKNSS